MHPDSNDRDFGKTLLSLARGWIAHALGGPDVHVPDVAAFARNAATFVTINHADGSLHGCIGSLEPRRPLYADVRANALAAAFLDPRSEPLRKEQLDSVVIEVSILGPLEKIDFTSEADAISKVRPGEDGLVLSWGPIRGVLLPQVWARVPDVPTFLAHLKRKAGLPPAFWSDDVELRRFGLQKWREGDDDESGERPPRRPARHAHA